MTPRPIRSIPCLHLHLHHHIPIRLFSVPLAITGSPLAVPTSRVTDQVVHRSLHSRWISFFSFEVCFCSFLSARLLSPVPRCLPCVCTRLRACARACMRPCASACARACACRRVHACVRVHAGGRVRAGACGCVPACMHTQPLRRPPLPAQPWPRCAQAPPRAHPAPPWLHRQLWGQR